MAFQEKANGFYDRVADNYNTNTGTSSVYPYLIRGIISEAFDQISVLDVGAGPGTVAEMLLKAGVGSVTLMEPSTNMISIAKKRLSTFISQQRVFTKQDALPNMDFKDSQFHAVMMNMVVHFVDEHPEIHLDATERPPVDKSTNTYPGMRKSFEETLRVLKPGGVFVVCTTLPHQLRYSRWYAEFMPWRAAWSYPREPSRAEYQHLLQSAGFEDIVFLVDTGCPLIDDHVLDDSYGIESEEWRASDSDFLLLTKEEEKEMLKKVRKARKSGELEKIMAQAKEHRDMMGQITLIVARKV